MSYEIGDRVNVKREWPQLDTTMTVVNILPTRNEICLQADHKGAGIWVTSKHDKRVSKLPQ